MKLNEYKIIFIAAGLIGVLLFASPALSDLIRLPSGEQFSELYLLGPDHMAQNYPNNIQTNQNYTIYVGVENHLGSSAYYVLYVKLGNETDPVPNNTLGASSPIQPLYEYRFSIADSTNWENLLSFSVSNATISGNNSQINSLQINDVTSNVSKSATWNSNSTSFTYRLFFELWLYNNQTGSFEFNNRYVSLRLNLTRTI